MRAIIIDDEVEAGDALRDSLQLYCPSIDIVGYGNNGKSGLELIRKIQPDLVFLDVEMPDLSGFEVLKTIGEINFALVFITAFNQYAIHAFEFSAIDYLLKPIDPPRLIEAIEKVQERHRLSQLEEQYTLLIEILQSKNPPSLNNRITFSTQEEIVFASLKDLIRIEAQHNCSSVFIKGLPKKITIAKHLKVYEQLFQNIPFMFRVHRGHIVNLYHVKKFIRKDGGYILVDSDQKEGKDIPIPVSNRQRDDLLERLARL